MKNKITQEDKELLLKDLSARLPYNVCVQIRYNTGEPCYGKLTPRDIQWFIDSKIENIKPYLRPMSSMTEEERKYYIHLLNLAKSDRIVISKGGLGTSGAGDIIDYLISHHFDYRGLISMGLALEASKNMY